MKKSGDLNQSDSQRALDNPLKVAGSHVFKPFARHKVKDPLVNISISNKSCNIPVEIGENLFDLVRS
jgi:hypothetical protein